MGHNWNADPAVCCCEEDAARIRTCVWGSGIRRLGVVLLGRLGMQGPSLSMSPRVHTFNSQSYTFHHCERQDTDWVDFEWWDWSLSNLIRPVHEQNFGTK